MLSIRHEAEATGNAAAALTGSRRAYFAALGGFVETPTYDREQLHAGASITGPAIVEEKDSTAVIGPGATASVDALLNLVVTFD